jgi:hypothetical protein
MPHDVNERANTLIRSGVAAAAAVLLTSTAAVAVDDVLTPEQRAMLDPAAIENSVLQTSQSWTTTVQRTGELPGQPGNAHLATVTVRTSTGLQATGHPQLTIDLTDAQCTDTCTTLRTAKGTITQPDGLDLFVGGAARIRLTITDQTPGVTITRADGIPADPLTIDATITPTPPFDPDVTLDNAVALVRSQTATEGRYTATGPSSAVPAVVFGSLLGIPLAAGDQGQVSFSVQRVAELPAFPPVRTAAERRPWLPATSGGRLTGEGEIRANRAGFLATAPVTSTGRTPEGNRHRLMVHLIATKDQRSLVAYLDSRTCAAGQAWVDCAEPPDGVRLTAQRSPAVVVGRDGGIVVTGTFAVAPGSVADQAPDAWGTLRVSGAWAPGAIGRPEHRLSLLRIGGDPQVHEERNLAYGTGDTALSPPRSVLAAGHAVVGRSIDPAMEFDDLAYRTR